jgi:hypothetical protein
MRLATPSIKWFRKWVKAHKSSGGGFRSALEKKDLSARAAELYRLGATPEAVGNATAKEQVLRVAYDIEQLRGSLYFGKKAWSMKKWNEIPYRGEMIQSKLPGLEC